MKKSVKMISVFLSLMLFLSCFGVSGFAYSDTAWDTYWETDEAQNGLIMQPGSNESERNFSWYMPAGTKSCCVLVSESPDMSDAQSFYGRVIGTQQGDCAAKVTVSGLKENTDYFYACVTDDEQGDTYTFSTVSDEFSAMYVTDIHVSDGESETSLKNHAKMIGEVVTQATEKKDINLILSAGDQATRGLRCEYQGLVSAPIMKTVSFATCIGNHDRKGADYKYFNNVPNEFYGTLNSYQGGDYWFVKGSCLFLIMDSNNGNGEGHSAFMKQAIAANPDAKWRIAVMHHDMYGQTMPNRESENRLIRLLWSQMFDENGIDLVLLGHSHYYSVSNVVYNGKSVQDVTPGCTVENAQGTVYMVSGSINHPRSDEEFSYGDNIGIGVEDISRIVYNVIDFSSDSITVHSYDYSTGEEFNTFTLSKTDDAKKPEFPFYRVLLRMFAGFIGKIYAFFNNFGRIYDLNEAGYDVNYATDILNNRNYVDGKTVFEDFRVPVC